MLRLNIAELSYIINKDEKEAIKYLEEAIKLGGDKMKERIKNKTTFDSIKDNQTFKDLLK